MFPNRQHRQPKPAGQHRDHPVTPMRMPIPMVDGKPTDWYIREQQREIPPAPHRAEPYRPREPNVVTTPFRFPEPEHFDIQPPEWAMREMRNRPPQAPPPAPARQPENLKWMNMTPGGMQTFVGPQPPANVEPYGGMWWSAPAPPQRRR